MPHIRRAALALMLLLAAACSAAGQTPQFAGLKNARTAKAQLSAGTVYAWGAGASGQIGGGATIDRDVPAKAGPVTAVAIAGGGAHSLLLDRSGGVWAWGWNAIGQLGLGTTTGPQRCPFSKPRTACSTVFARVPGLNAIAAVAAGDEHSAALAAGGTVWTWGNNQYGELGDGTVTTTGCNCIDSPVQANVPAAVTQISAGGRHTAALGSDGTVWTWGWNRYGQLGDGTTADSDLPVLVNGVSASAISAGFYHTLAIGTDGNVYAWGRNTLGQLGNGTTHDSDLPVKVSGLSNAIEISAGGQFSMALLADGTLWTWGDNGYGELGVGSSKPMSTVPVQLSGIAGVKAIAAGHKHAAAVDASGSIWAWGQNADGELGDGTTTGSNVPVRSRLHGASMLGAGDQFTIALH
ncbi:MAG TPA: hypothetical protein VFA29_08165 [Candidatus Baltobacteraceae bacterium]|nr:hypothetical protein [Candidatus Baltobacteraceae bacterium]